MNLFKSKTTPLYQELIKHINNSNITMHNAISPLSLCTSFRAHNPVTDFTVIFAKEVSGCITEYSIYASNESQKISKQEAKRLFDYANKRYISSKTTEQNNAEAAKEAAEEARKAAEFLNQLTISNSNYHKK